MFSLRARTSACLFLVVCLILTATATFNQVKHNEARIRSELGIVASRNADDIIERIYRLQYGLRDLNGMVMGAHVAGQLKLTGASVSQVFQPSLELNGATGYGFSDGHGRQAHLSPPLYIHALDEASPAPLTAIWRSDQGQAAMRAATLREAPTLSEAIGPFGTTGTLLLVRSNPLPGSESVDTFVFFELPQVVVDLSPHPSLYRLQIDDVTHPGPARHLLRTDHTAEPTEQPVQWSSTREIFGRRWRFHAELGPEFATSIHLTPPKTVAITGGAISVFLTGCLLAAFALRSKSAAMRMQDKQLASIVQASSDAFVTHDANGWILSCNAAASDLFKISPQDLIGKNWANLLAADGMTPPTIPHAAIETTMRRGDGSLIEVSVSTFALSNLSQDGQLICRTIRDNRAKVAADHAMLDHAQNLQRMVDARTEESAAAMQHLQTVLDGMPAMIAYADCQLVNRFANEAFASWVGIDKQASIGTSLNAMLGGTLISALFPHINAVLNGAPQSVQHACRRPADNQAQHLEFHFLPDAQDGVVRGFYLIAHDITPLKTSQTQLIEATHQSEVLLETIRCHAIYSVADTNGTIIDVNDEFCRISGYARDELIGKNHRIINSGAHPPTFWREMWSCISQGQTWHGEVCNRAKSGELYWVDSIIAPFRAGNGRIDKYISLRTDITARKRAEVRLLTSSEGFLERAGQIAGVGGWELDLATGEMSLTRQSRAIFGIPDQENLSLDGSLSFFLPPYRDQLRRVIFDAIQHHHNWDLELPFVNRQGVQRWVRTLAEVEYAPDSNTPSRLVGAMQDVTAKHETEEALTNAKRIAEAANSAKTEFLANMSHEIRTPLNAVIGMTHVLGEALKHDDQREWVAKIQSASKSLLAILNDVLDLSKIEAGELRIDHSEFSVRGLVADMKALFSTQARTKGLDFSISVAKDVPDRLMGDPLRIRQVLTNLLGNALKFTREGSVSLMVGCITRSPESVQLQFAVMDTGIGMTPESAQTIFDPFTQADASTTRRFGGTGLGLSIVKRLVTLMNGNLGVHSRLQAGSEFWFRLPLAIGRKQLATSDDLSKLQVCILGADSAAHKTLRVLIEQLGWHLASDADSATSADLAICLGDQPQSIGPIPIQYPDHIDRPWTALSLFNAAQDAAWRHGNDVRRLYLYSHVEALGAHALHQVRILVVDDSDINREVATRLLLAEGATVDQAANGHDALALLTDRHASYDAVLMDIQMPFMDGMQATQKIRQDLGLSTLPIVALTAGVLASERERALSAGMTDFVSKPLDPVLLLSSLRHHIQQYRGQPLPLVPSIQGSKPMTLAWPSLPGIDMAHVTAEFKFDQSGYQRLLTRMVSEFGTQSVDWLLPASPLASPKLMQARVHKLAGTAAVLGASDIAKLAKTTEHALRDHPSVDVSIELAAIYESMTELEDGLLAWRQNGRPPSLGSSTDISTELDQQALLALSEALQHHRLDALSLFESLAPPLRQVMPPDAFNQLEQAMQSLDFGQAWGLIRAMDSMA